MYYETDPQIISYVHDKLTTPKISSIFGWREWVPGTSQDVSKFMIDYRATAAFGREVTIREKVRSRTSPRVFSDFTMQYKDLNNPNKPTEFSIMKRTAEMFDEDYFLIHSCIDDGMILKRYAVIHLEKLFLNIDRGLIEIDETNNVSSKIDGRIMYPSYEINEEENMAYVSFNITYLKQKFAKDEVVVISDGY